MPEAGSCVVCGGTLRRPVLALEAWEIVACTGCDTHTLHPEPDQVRLEEFEEGSAYEGAMDLAGAMLERSALTVAALEAVVAPGALLDVGCGPGFLLEAARGRGWRPVGVDPSPVSVSRATAAGFEAHQGMLEDLDLPEASFDALAMLQVVEHVPDPRPLLAACRRLLRPGGALVVATPNPSSLLARVKRERFNYWIPPMHCVWYTPASLAQLLAGAGFLPARAWTWSARVSGLHDGRDIIGSFRAGRALPGRVRSVLGDVVAVLADRTGRGSIVEQIVVRA